VREREAEGGVVGREKREGWDRRIGANSRQQAARPRLALLRTVQFVGLVVPIGNASHGMSENFGTLRTL
jgi:hypothetical protein